MEIALAVVAALLIVPLNELRAIAVGGLLVTAVSVLVATTLLPGGCSLSPGAGEGRATQAPCQPSGAALDLGAHAFDVAPQDHVRVSGGRYLLTATGFVHGGPFDPAAAGCSAACRRCHGHRACTGRCERTAITIPMPASSDTADVPP